MRMSIGKLNRRLPRVVPTEADVMLRYVDDGTGRASSHYVSTCMPVRWDEPFPRYGGSFETFREAKAEAWRQAAARGGRLLDFQRGMWAEQPLWWDFDIDLSDEAEPWIFDRKGKGEARLKRALEGWIGLPSLDALKLARMLIHQQWKARYALTQTEALQAHRLYGTFEGLTPMSRAMAAKITYRAGEIVPAHLEKPITFARAA